MDLRDRRDVRPRAAAHPGQVEDDHLAQSGRGAGAPPRRAPAGPASRGSGESVRPSRRSTLSDRLGQQRGRARRRRPASRSRRRRGARRAPAAPAPAPARSLPASTMTRASRASARITASLSPVPVIASRSATYSSSSRKPRASSRRVAERAIAFALAAHGVDRRTVLEIDDSDHAHAGHASGGHRRREHQGRPAAGDVAADRLAPVRGLARPRRRSPRCCARSPPRPVRRTPWRSR